MHLKVLAPYLQLSVELTAFDLIREPRRGVRTQQHWPDRF